jgi:KDO2-lipid IV(A) lauroyltransferase
VTTIADPPARKRRWRYRLEYVAVRTLRLLACTLPAHAARSTGAALGGMIGRLWSKRRTIAVENIERAMGDTLSAGQAAAIAADTFRTMGQTAFEVFRFGHTSPAELLERVEGTTDVFRWAAEQGKGAVLVTGHFGNWEVFGAWIRAQGYPIDVVVKPMHNPYVDALYNRCRAAMDVGVIHSQIATKEIIRSLQQKRFVAIVADQYAGAEGIDVDFFGRPASTPRGPAVLALKFGCPLLTGVLEQRCDGRFIPHIDGPIEYQRTGDMETDVCNITQEIVARLEKHIRRTPGQWLWTHRRWRD